VSTFLEDLVRPLPDGTPCPAARRFAQVLLGLLPAAPGLRRLVPSRDAAFLRGLAGEAAPRGGTAPRPTPATPRRASCPG
jgi:hypothetical protein